MTNKEEKMEVRYRGGWLRCYKSTDPDNPGFIIMMQPDGIDCELDVAIVENTDPELNQTNHEESLRVLVYDNVFQEDYNHDFTLNGDDIREVAEIIRKEDEEWQSMRRESM